jgi:hypothetical protein
VESPLPPDLAKALANARTPLADHRQSLI